MKLIQYSHFTRSIIGWSSCHINPKCTKLKILKFEFQPEVEEEETNFVSCPYLSWIQETISNFKLKNLQELHLGSLDIDLNKPAFKTLLEMMAKNMPKLQLLCLTEELDNMDEEEFEEFDEKCQEFALAKNIKLEIARYN